MKNYLLLPIIFLKFWYFDAPRSLIGFFASLNHAFFELFSLPLFLRTYFKPLKNEYRQGLVGFSIAMGLVIIYQFSLHESPKIAQLLFNLFIMCEVFFHYKISKVVPSVPVAKNNGKDIYQSFTMQALYGFIVDAKTSVLIRKLLRYPQIQL